MFTFRTPRVRQTDSLEHEHTPEAIRDRLDEGPRQSYVRDWIYGGIDGVVTTFAIVSGVVGGNLERSVVIILGVANLIPDGFSMAASNYSGTKSEVEEWNKLREVEQRHIRIAPQGEREEVRGIFRRKGFSGHDLDRAVEVITADDELWVRTMLTDEYGLAAEVRSPMRAAISTFTAFVICGAVPLVPFVLGASNAFPVALALTLTVFFLIGAAKSLWSVRSWWRSATETLLIGSLAASLAYLIGFLLRGLASGSA